VSGSFCASNVVFGTNVLLDTSYRSGSDFTGPVLISQDFLVKYDSAGNVLWAQTVTVNNSWYYFPTIGLDTDGDAFFCDYFSGNAVAGTITVTNATSGQLNSVLLAKFDSEGNALWAKLAAQIVNGASFNLAPIAVDLRGNSLIAGSYYGGEAAFPSTTLPAATNNTAFVAKFDAAGDFLWANVPTNQVSVSVCVDAIGNIYTYQEGEAVSKYTGDGTLLWTTNFPGPLTLASGAADPAGTLFFVGGTESGDHRFTGFTATQFSGPTLNIQPLGNQILISWFTNEVGLSLESSPSLAGPWSPVTNPSPTIIGNQYVVTNGVPAGSQFYRLGNL
jgi:hypothetical protein